MFRNGPGVLNVYGTPLKHPIDGDGLIARITFTGSRIHFKSRFIDTPSHIKEAEAQRMLFPGQMGTKPVLMKPRMPFRDPAHTNAFFWGQGKEGKLLACHEYCLPHEICPHSLKTLGQTSYGFWLIMLCKDE